MYLRGRRYGQNLILGPRKATVAQLEHTHTKPSATSCLVPLGDTLGPLLVSPINMDWGGSLALILISQGARLRSFP